ncbi:MAG: helix-turn-helix domain-containing protein [Candidatus Omnitrophica bacterium]|nr:helix-turn-helix domain-containing protein [Candidatus Omnitrophota bacterium]
MEGVLRKGLKLKTAEKAGKKKKSKIALGEVIETRRKLIGWKAVELARRSGLHPGTLDAIEKGRIRTPSFKNLEAIARALGVSLASLFSEGQGEPEKIFSAGTQKGQYTLEFSKGGFRVVCYTPLVPNLFVGKVIVKGEASIERRLLPTAGMVFVQVIMGKLSIRFEAKDHLVREGHYAFFDGSFAHSFSNPHYKESTFLLATAPSFLSAGARRA